jgi:hypothetical protein
MNLRQLNGDFSVARYAPDTPLPQLYAREFCSVSRTRNEVTIVCETDLLPAGMQKKEDGWVCLEVDGVFDFNITGILNAITGPLAGAEIALFAVSTFDTDYILVKKTFLQAAKAVLAKNNVSVGV